MTHWPCISFYLLWVLISNTLIFINKKRCLKYRFDVLEWNFNEKVDLVDLITHAYRFPFQQKERFLKLSVILQKYDETNQLISIVDPLVVFSKLWLNNGCVEGSSPDSPDSPVTVMTSMFNIVNIGYRDVMKRVRWALPEPNDIVPFQA